MWKLLFGLLLLACLAAAVAIVPIHGRTVLDCYNAARGPVDFLERSLYEGKVALGLVKRPVRAQPPRTAKANPHSARKPAPVEELSDWDRAAVDRLVAEHAR